MSSLIDGEGRGRRREGGRARSQLPNIVKTRCQNKMRGRYTFIKYT